MNDKELVALAIEYGMGCEVDYDDARYPYGICWYDGDCRDLLRVVRDRSAADEREKIAAWLEATGRIPEIIIAESIRNGEYNEGN